MAEMKSANRAETSGAEPLLLAPTSPRASLRRIGALMTRYAYLLRGSVVRLVELVYWPFLQMLTWGFLQQYLAGARWASSRGAGVLIGAVLLGISYFAELGFATTFIEEVWSRNLGNLLTSPLRPIELVLALSFWSTIHRPASPLLPWPPISSSASTCWISGSRSGRFLPCLCLQAGHLGSFPPESFCAMALARRTCLVACLRVATDLLRFYPVAVLPAWLQPIALALPPTHVFESMRSILVHHTFDPTQLLWALGLTAVYLVAGYAIFTWFLMSARINGTLLQLGE